MRRHLRYEAHDDGAWTFHLGDVGADATAGTACGAYPTEPCGDGEHAEALRLLLGHEAADATWCPACLADLANLPQLALRRTVEPDKRRAQRRRADLAAGRLPDLADLEADVAAIEAEGAAILADLAALGDDDEHAAELARVHAATEPVLAWHLTTYMYPPVTEAMLPAALEAITGMVADDPDRPVHLPTGEHTTAGELVAAWRLEGFVDDAYPEGTDG